MRMDSGAQISVVSDGDYTGESIKPIGLGGHVTIARLANIQIRTEKFSFLMRWQ